MSNSEPDRLIFQNKWTMSGSLHGDPAEPLNFFVVAVEMRLIDAPAFVEELVGVINDGKVNRLRVRIATIMNAPEFEPTARHAFAFTGAATSSVDCLQGGITQLFGELHQRWPKKTLSLIPMLWNQFLRVQAMAATGGCWLSPPLSQNQ